MDYTPQNQPLTEAQIRRIVQSEMDGSRAESRFGLNPLQRHIHNNLDSPFVFQPILTYIGVINHVGVPVLLPKGWTMQASGFAGVYTVVHNLGKSAFYAVTANAYNSSGTGYDTITVLPQENSVTFLVFDPATHGASVCDFNFILTVVNNRATQVPTYELTSLP
jgi:hypothetical protein